MILDQARALRPGTQKGAIALPASGC